MYILFYTDGLCGMMEAFGRVYPKNWLQCCIVHQIRSSTHFVRWKDIKQVAANLKRIYASVTMDEAEDNLLQISEKTVSFLCEKLGGQLGSSEYLL